MDNAGQRLLTSFSVLLVVVVVVVVVQAKLPIGQRSGHFVQSGSAAFLSWFAAKSSLFV